MTPDWICKLVPTKWTDKDYDILVDYIIDKELGLKDVDELE